MYFMVGSFPVGEFLLAMVRSPDGRSRRPLLYTQRRAPLDFFSVRRFVVDADAATR
jgi:hypothetical protein